MKLLKKFVWLLASVALVSCGSDDDNNTPSFELTSETIQGEFTMNDYFINTTTNTIVSEVDVEVIVEETDSNLENVVLNLSGGSYTTSGFIRRDIETGGELTTDDETILADNSGTYTLDVEEETITFTSDDITADFVLIGMYSIESISTSKLEIEKSETTVDGDATTINTESFSFER